MRRNATLLSVVAAFGLLVHAGGAAASIWCAVQGSLVAACPCTSLRGEPNEERLKWEQGHAGCCSELVEAQEVEPGSYGPNLLPPGIIQDRGALEPAAPTFVALASRAPLATSPPLEQLATIVIIR